MRVAISRRRSRILSRLAYVALLVGACDTFNDPPGLNPEGGGGEGGSAGSAGDDSSAGTAGKGGGGSAGTSGAGGSAGTPPDAGVGPWWAYKNEQGCQSAGVPSTADRTTYEDSGPDLPPIYIAQSR